MCRGVLWRNITGNSFFNPTPVLSLPWKQAFDLKARHRMQGDGLSVLLGPRLTHARQGMHACGHARASPILHRLTSQASPASRLPPIPAGPQPSDSLDHKPLWTVHSGCFHGVCAPEESGEGRLSRTVCAAGCHRPPARNVADPPPMLPQVINATVCPLYENPDPEYNYTIRQYDAGWKAATTYPCAGAGSALHASLVWPGWCMAGITPQEPPPHQPVAQAWIR